MDPLRIYPHVSPGNLAYSVVEFIKFGLIIKKYWSKMFEIKKNLDLSLRIYNSLFILTPNSKIGGKTKMFVVSSLLLALYLFSILSAKFRS